MSKLDVAVLIFVYTLSDLKDPNFKIYFPKEIIFFLRTFVVWEMWINLHVSMHNVHLDSGTSQCRATRCIPADRVVSTPLPHYPYMCHDTLECRASAHLIRFT